MLFLEVEERYCKVVALTKIFTAEAVTADFRAIAFIATNISA
jgi:hypothetical protein